MIRISLQLFALSMFIAPVSAADFFVDPTDGASSNDGSRERPWRSLQEVFDKGLVESQTWDSLPRKSESKLIAKNAGAPVKAGDTIWLRIGNYGDLVIQGYYNSGYVTIAAEEGHTPRFRSIRIRSGSHWTLRSLHVSPEFGPGEKPGTMIDLDSHGWHGPVHDLIVEQCVLQSAQDTSDWTAEQWNQLSCTGINADGTRVTIRHNRLKNVDTGINVGASHALVEHNTVENFAGDGLRGLGDHSTFQYNTVKNCYDVNGNHDDGFQSWASGPKGIGSGEIVGLVLRGNTIINYEDPNQPHRGALQGIGCFDGMFVDWIIENNVIVVDHYHGITLGGARGCRIVNNTVIDPNDQRPGPVAIRIAKHKNGTPSSNCVVRNNLASALSVQSGAEMTVDHNLVVEDPDGVFIDFAKGDLQLGKGSPAIDKGADLLAPETDILGTVRPSGPAVDIGAYEYVAE